MTENDRLRLEVLWVLLNCSTELIGEISSQEIVGVMRAINRKIGCTDDRLASTMWFGSFKIVVGDTVVYERIDGVSQGGE